MMTLREILKDPLYPVAFVFALAAAHVFFAGLAFVTKGYVAAIKQGAAVDEYYIQFGLGVLGIAASLALATWFYRKI